MKELQPMSLKKERTECVSLNVSVIFTIIPSGTEWCFFSGSKRGVVML